MSQVLHVCLILLINIFSIQDIFNDLLLLENIIDGETHAKIPFNTSRDRHE